MANHEIPYKIYLSEDESPKAWYNVRADMVKKPAPAESPNPSTYDLRRPSAHVLR